MAQVSLDFRGQDRGNTPTSKGALKLKKTPLGVSQKVKETLELMSKPKRIIKICIKSKCLSFVLTEVDMLCFRAQTICVWYEKKISGYCVCVCVCV